MLFCETMLYEAKINQNQMIEDAANYRRISQARKAARRRKKEARQHNKEGCCSEVKLNREKKRHITRTEKLLDSPSQTA
ncbi:MAG: hypothetical protein ISR78_00575 [Spirochaetia bacterium]|nr:hypothetical protein [Spirochaetia bacterium]